MNSTLLVALGCVAICVFGQCSSEVPSGTQIENNNTVEVLIDIAHGGADPGGISRVDGTKEKDAVVTLGRALTDLLVQKGVRSIADRSDDEFVSLEDRIKLTNAMKPGLVVSLHLNASRDPLERGFSIFYQGGHEESRRLALVIQKELSTLPYLKDNGVKIGSFHLLKSIDAPAVLVHLAYLSNSDDMSALMESNNQAEIVRLLAKAIVQSREC